MKILKLEWKNIFSYGDDITEIEFGESAKLWQLSGVSGSGKSSLLCVPKLLLYGKTEGSDGKPVSVTDIANRLNKKGWIRGTIRKGSDLYIVERMFSPSGLTIYKNGENVDVSGMKTLQSIIDDEILDGMPYQIFANVMTLSLNNFKSFISMTPADKRLIIDKIFSLEIINKVHELVKGDMKDLGNSINSGNSQIYTLEQMLNTSRTELENLSVTGSNTSTKARLEELKEKIQTCQSLYQQQTELYASAYNKYNEYVQTYNSITTWIQQKNYELTTVNNQIGLFSMDKCPTCGTPFNSEEFSELRDKLNDKKAEIEKMIFDQEESLQKVKYGMDEYLNLVNGYKDNVGKIYSKQGELTGEYNTLSKVLESSDQGSAIQNIINQTEDTKRKLEEELSKSGEKMKLLEIMEEMYSADGIKRQLMDNYIPTLNKEVAETLEYLGFPYTLEFDNNFDAHLQHLGIDIKPQSLSTGEHKKVDLTVLCSMLKMLKRKYPQINLVCLDETVSSLDYESSTEIIKYLKEISIKMNLNIFIVSHTTLDENLFDIHLSVEKQYEYSKLSVI